VEQEAWQWGYNVESGLRYDYDGMFVLIFRVRVVKGEAERSRWGCT
jgi:hypothetical protein